MTNFNDHANMGSLRIADGNYTIIQYFWADGVAFYDQRMSDGSLYRRNMRNETEARMDAWLDAKQHLAMGFNVTAFAD